MFLSGLALIVTGGWLTERMGLKWSSASGVAICGVGLLVIGTAFSFNLLLAGCLVYGFGMTWMYLIYGVFISRHFHRQRQKAFLMNNMVLSLMGGTGPALLGFWISSGLNWRKAFLFIGTLNIVFAFCLFLWGHQEKEALTQKAAESIEPGGKDKMPVLLTLGMWLIGLAYVLHGIAEIGIISWAGKLYHERLGISEEKMALFISANITSFAVGRFLLTFIAGRFRDLALLGLCASGGTLFFALTLLNHNYYFGLFFMAFSGVFMSGNAPSMNSYLAQRFGSRLEYAFAIFQGFGALGSATAPRLVGFAGDRIGLEKAVWLIPISSGTLALLAFLWNLLQKRKGQSNFTGAPAAARQAD
jgi:fucose permease